MKTLALGLRHKTRKTPAIKASSFRAEQSAAPVRLISRISPF
jgi:hypothetical protein